MKTTYRETPLLERSAAPVMQLADTADAILVRLFMKALSWSETFVEKEAISGGAFILSAITGMMFILQVAAYRPELNFSKEETFKMCFLICGAVMLLRFLCGRSARKLKALPGTTQKKSMEILQPSRMAMLVFFLGISIFGTCQIGKYCFAIWYLDGYFYLALCALLSLIGVYAHSAAVFLEIKK